jgi:hypothetical protein
MNQESRKTGKFGRNAACVASEAGLSNQKMMSSLSWVPGFQVHPKNPIQFTAFLFS